MQVVLGSLVGPLDSSDDAALDLAYPWPDSGRWLRAMMLQTLDGAVVGPDGKSGSISSPADQRIFSVTRRFCDAVVIGAGTFRAERYQPLRARPELAQARTAAGLAPAPVVVIVSASLDLPWQEPVFTESAQRPIVVAPQGPDQGAIETGSVHADLIQLRGPEVDLAEMLDVLADRGLRRVVCEGGPHLLSALTAAGLVDEYDLTIAPLTTAGGQIRTSAAAPAVQRYSLTQVIADESGYLFGRYLRRDDRETA